MNIKVDAMPINAQLRICQFTSRFGYDSRMHSTALFQDHEKDHRLKASSNVLPVVEDILSVAVVIVGVACYELHCQTGYNTGCA